jgi:hypothetical protein
LSSCRMEKLLASEVDGGGLFPALLVCFLR